MRCLRCFMRTRVVYARKTWDKAHQNMPSLHDPLPMVQKLLDEERQAVRTALQAVDEHTRQKRKELVESHRKWMRENKPKEDKTTNTKRPKTKQDASCRRKVEEYEHYLHYTEKKRSVYLDVICEEDDEQSSIESKKDKVRLSSRNDNFLLVDREAPLLPPIHPTWKQRNYLGKGDRAKLNNWQHVADNFIDSDARKRGRLRINGKNNKTQLHLNYQNDLSDKGNVDQELGLQKKRQYMDGPTYCSSNSRWVSNIPSLASSPD
ncbi:uncharacterized protein LOC111639122 isoform X2 [Centruroides sculpturatus]|uniref:uncharacterized protein LOC111639122 isoform X2 n=1 Tax=Centruroides sculpturatus TaxID=218467 RepID=UPI000C6DC1CC|nr:uncharacterized protein LOC111639122 isoform X2 [Centruroides sculpturatus]